MLKEGLVTGDKNGLFRKWNQGDHSGVFDSLGDLFLVIDAVSAVIPGYYFKVLGKVFFDQFKIFIINLVCFIDAKLAGTIFVGRHFD